MKPKIFRTSIGIVIFLSLIIATVAIAEPLYRYGKERIASFETKMISLLEEKTGLSISYESLSPSILSKINIKGIVVSDSESKEILFNVKKTSLSYNLFSKGTGKISGLTVDGINFRFDAIQNAEIIEKLVELTGGAKSENAKSENAASENAEPKETNPPKENQSGYYKILENISKLKLPFDVEVKNVAVVYSDTAHDLRLNIKTVSLNQNETHGYLDTNISGSFRYSNLENARFGQRPFVMGSTYNLFARILPSLDGSYLTLGMTPLSGVDMSFNGLEVLFSYNKNEVVLQTTKMMRNLEFVAKGNLEKMLFDAKINTTDFKLFELLKYRTYNKFGRFFEHLRVNLDAKADFDLSDMTHPKFTYDVKSNGFLPHHTLTPDFYAEVDVSGDETLATITKGTLDSTMAGGEAFLTVDLPPDLNFRKMQPSGVVTVDHWIMPKRTEPISAEIYIEPANNGFMCFAPQVFLGSDLSYTALQVNFSYGTDSLDFIVDMDDYSHIDYDTPGHINLDGSFIFGQQRYMQMTGSVSNMFIDSGMRLVGFCTTSVSLAEKLNNNASKFAPYISTDEIYFSTDYDNISYNAPYCLAANTQKEDELLMVSFDGSLDNFNVSSLNLLFQGQTVNGNGMIDFSDRSDAKNRLFSTDFSINSIPYFINGSYSDKILNVSGNYNLDASFELGETSFGTFRFDNFPLQLGKVAIAMSLDSSISFMNIDEFSAIISNFSIEEPTGKLALNPSVKMSGTANQYGIVMDSINYTDNSSVLNGSGSILWNVSQVDDEMSVADSITRILDSAHLTFDIQNPISPQRVAFNCDISNPTRKRIGSEGWKDKFNISADAAVTAFPISAFIPDQMLDNTLSASVLVTGTVENPIVTGVLENISLTWWGIPFIAKGSIFYDTNGFTVTDANASWSSIKVENGSASFDAKNFTGQASAKLGGTFWENSLDAPMEVSFTTTGGTSDSEKLKNFSLVFNFPKLTGSLLKRDTPFKLTVLRSGGRFDFFTNDEGGIIASIEEGGLITARTGEKSPFTMGIDGILTNNYMDLAVSDVSIDVGRLSKFMRLPQIEFNTGVLKGSARAVGLPNDPELTGAFQIQGFSMNWPGYLASPLETEKILVTLGQDSVVLPETTFKCGKKGRVDFNAIFFLDRWQIGDSLMHLETKGKNLIPLDLKLPFVRYKGEGSVNADLKYDGNTFEFDGPIFVQNGEFTFSLQRLLSGDLMGSDGEPSDLIVNFKSDIKFGNHLQFYINPLVRGLVAPSNELSFMVDGNSGDFMIKGEVDFRGGDVTYLNRNFYMKEGKLAFNENQDKIDPLITVRAEARERDSDGNQVRIILTSKNQPISSFRPMLSASPAKSEREIMEIMGQIVTGDSNDIGSLLLSGGDYLVQATLVRKLENALRKLCKFDIFSVRTMVLQNAVKQGLNFNRSDKQINVGNFFDNSTVYIGKYFGSSIYVDAMMHWAYDENKANKSDSALGGLVFQPEIGFELTSPFVAIRMGLAPDIEAMKNSFWVPNASITLSWKFNF